MQAEMDTRVIASICEYIDEAQKSAPRLLIAIDGRCAAGKTTLAARLRRLTGCNVLHMDDFYLRPSQRTPARLDTPGGNVDHERFLHEALLPLREGKRFSYRPFDCHTGRYKTPVEVVPNGINIVEGAYSCHPALWDSYDIHIFLTVAPNEQIRRIGLRNGDNAGTFIEKWIPFEETYFRAYDIEKRCELRF